MATRYQTRRQSTRRSPLAWPRPAAAVTTSCRPNALAPAPKPRSLKLLNFLWRSRRLRQADLGWRISGPLGHSTVAEPQDLEGPCVDLRANELWVVVPTDTFLARLPNLSPKVQEGAPIVLWRGLVRAQTAEPPQHTAWCAHGARMVRAWCTRVVRIGQATHDGWHVRYGGGELSTEWVTSGQAALLWHTLTPTMHSTRLQRSRSQGLGSQRPVAAHRSGGPLTCSGPPSGPKPRFGDCRLHSVWPSQARGRGGHACGCHAATILRLLRRGGIHARPGRRMSRRAQLYANHISRLLGFVCICIYCIYNIHTHI